MLGGEFACRADGASAKDDFKHPEQVQRDERDKRGQAHDENRTAKLHPPASVIARRLDADDQGGEREEREQHAGRVDQAEVADTARLAFGLADEAEDFQRDDRQHARHDVENQPADEGEQQHLPERLRGQ